MIDDIPENVKKDILAILGLEEGMRITTVRTAHKKYMEHKKKLQVSDSKPGPAKGKAGGKGPKYMPKGRVTEGMISEISDNLRKRYIQKATADADRKHMQGQYDQGARSVGPSRKEIRDRGSALVTKAINRYGHVAKAASKLKDHTAQPAPQPTKASDLKQHAVYEKGNRKVEIYHDVKHGLYHVHQFQGGKLSAKPTKYAKPGYAEHHAKTFLGEDVVEEGFLSSKLKSIKKYMTGAAKEQQARLSSKLQDQLAAQPAKIAAADGLEDIVNAKDRDLDLRNRLKAVQNPEAKRRETEGMFGALGGQYLSGQRSTANVFRSTARSLRRFGKSADGLKQALPKLDAAISSMDKVIGNKRAAARAASAAATGAALGNPVYGVPPTKKVDKKVGKKVNPDLTKRHADAKSKASKKLKPY